MREILLRAFVIDTVLSLCRPSLSLSPSLTSPLLPPPPPRLSFCASGASTASPCRKRMKERRKSIMDWCCAVLLSLSPVWTSGLCCILMLQRDGSGGGVWWWWWRGGGSVPLSQSKRFENKWGERKWIWKKKEGEGVAGLWKAREIQKKKRKEAKRQFFEEFAGNTDLL